jgi:hypothetical protein
LAAPEEDSFLGKDHMADNAAQDRQSGGPLPVAAFSVVERQRMELPVAGKWPKAWRLLFVIGAALAFWACIAFLIRWL